nr:protein 122 [synthetic construct]
MNNTCDCLDWHQDLGGHAENIVNNVVQWLCFGLSIANLAYFAWSTFRATCGWEEVYVCSVELTKISIEMWHEYSNPFTIYTSTGRWVTWLRYAEWLMTCPVILIHLSNLSGLTHDYSARTMGLLVSDIGTIVLGISAAFATGPLKAIFFCFACCYGATTMFHAAKVFYDSHNEVPKGACQTEVKWLAGLYFFSWNMYPVIWLLSQEGYQVLTWHEAGILYNIADILAKNIWTLIGHDLRLRIHKFVAAGGKLNKASAHNTVEADNESKKSSP